ncbi:MAG: hypothetical protein WCC41_08915 [Rhodomicrobium sp.]
MPEPDGGSSKGAQFMMRVPLALLPQGRTGTLFWKRPCWFSCVSQPPTSTLDEPTSSVMSHATVRSPCPDRLLYHSPAERGREIRALRILAYHALRRAGRHWLTLGAIS